jgi:predicted porin
MKKSLLALAVLGAFAGAASAQTNVTIYGIADVGVQYSKPEVNGVGENTTGLTSGIRNGSRLGFKGSEDLGGGLSAIFTLENGFNLDDGTLAQGGRLFGRQAWVGLQGGFGALKLGRQNTPIHNALDSIDPFGTGLAGNIENNFNGGLNGDVRMDNTINYSLPTNLGGFYGEFAYGFGEVAGDNSANRKIGLSVGYANGPIKAVLSYHNVDGATDAAEDDRTVMLGGTYDFGVAKAHAAFANNKGAGASTFGGVAQDLATAVTGAGFALPADLKSRDYMLGVSAPVGAGTVMASWTRKDFRDLPAGAEAEVDYFAVGYAHNLSKRTNVYTSLARGDGETDGIAPAQEVKSTVFNVGLQHRF